MIEFTINVVNWDVVAQDRVGWRAAVLVRTKDYEDNRVQRAVETRQRCKYPTVNDFTVFYYCRHCQKWRIGCFSHERCCVPRKIVGGMGGGGGKGCLFVFVLVFCLFLFCFVLFHRKVTIHLPLSVGQHWCSCQGPGLKYVTQCFLSFSFLFCCC